MKKMFLFICMLLVLTVSLSFAPAVINAEDENGLATKEDFVGNLTCGNSASDKEVVRFHENLPIFTSRIYDFLKILTPVIIIIAGILDLLKAVTAQKEDEIKKSQRKFVNRLIAGSIVFLVFVIVEFVINFVAETDVSDAMSCVNCFVNREMGENGCTEAPERN